MLEGRRADLEIRWSCCSALNPLALFCVGLGVADAFQKQHLGQLERGDGKVKGAGVSSWRNLLFGAGYSWDDQRCYFLRTQGGEDGGCRPALESQWGDFLCRGHGSDGGTGSL